jgi:DNA polymerase III subunit epsilon
MKYLDKLTNKLIKSPLTIDEVKSIIKKYDSFYNNLDLEIELLISNGYPILQKDDTILLTTATTSIQKQTFCVVDIETNAGNAQKGQIIEIGAVKYRNGEIVDKYESLVNAKDIPKNVQEITNITPKMLEKAPSLKTVMEEFKIFVEDDIFVAHDIKFDYKFVSDTFEQLDLGKLCNRKLCTIDLAKRVIKSDRYGLRFLKEILDINLDNHHRAFSDALSSAIVLEKCIKGLPKDIKTSEDLIAFSKSDNIVNNSKDNI